MFKEIFPILICLSHHKNNDIAQKIYELNSLIKKNIIADVFELNSLDLNSEKYTCEMLIEDSDGDLKHQEIKGKYVKTLNSLNAKKSSFKNNPNRKSSETDKQSISGLEPTERKFDSKIEALKKLILDELAENLLMHQVKNGGPRGNDRGEMDGNKLNNPTLLRNQSTTRTKEKLTLCLDKAHNQAINNFGQNNNNNTNTCIDKKNEKLKLNKTGLNINGNAACSNRSVTNSFNCSNSNNNSFKHYENCKSGFFNSKEENKKDYFNKENIYTYESCVIDNTNMLTTESYNIDSSLLSLKENKLIGGANSDYQTSRLRRNSSIDYKEKPSRDKAKRKGSANSKGKQKFLIV